MFNCAICYFVKYYSIYIDLCNYSIYNSINNRKQKPVTTYQANTGTQKERHPYYNTGEKVNQYV
nr:MAG TPA: hypothetical protein [Caudoviricetes sp.]DAW94575.1 MAG TPA: hypothetical protein [Bacteriophage sp.]